MRIAPRGGFLKVKRNTGRKWGRRSKKPRKVSNVRLGLVRCNFYFGLLFWFGRHPVFNAIQPAEFEMHTVYGVFKAATLEELQEQVLSAIGIWNDEDIVAMASVPSQRTDND